MNLLPEEQRIKSAWLFLLAKALLNVRLQLTIQFCAGLLKDIQSGMIEDGTAIGTAIANGVNRLKDSEAKSKIMILLTDGVNNSGEIDPNNSRSNRRKNWVLEFTRLVLEQWVKLHIHFKHRSAKDIKWFRWKLMKKYLTKFQKLQTENIFKQQIIKSWKKFIK